MILVVMVPKLMKSVVLAANRLQTVGECPRAFFFNYGLDLAPPDETVVDPDQWLDAMTRGLLLHELFEVFVRELVAEKRFPEVATGSQIHYISFPAR